MTDITNNQPNDGVVRRLSGAAVTNDNYNGTQASIAVDGNVLVVVHHDASNSTILLKGPDGREIGRFGALPQVRPYLIDSDGRSMRVPVSDGELGSLNFRIEQMFRSENRLDVEEAREIVQELHSVAEKSGARLR